MINQDQKILEEVYKGLYSEENEESADHLLSNPRFDGAEKVDIDQFPFSIADFANIDTKFLAGDDEDSRKWINYVQQGKIMSIFRHNDGTYEVHVNADMPAYDDETDTFRDDQLEKSGFIFGVEVDENGRIVSSETWAS